jgi:hypothetical protein
MEKSIGKVTHFFGKLSVAVLDITNELTVGDEIHILGHITDFTQRVTSMEIEHKMVELVGPGMEVAMKVEEYVREGDEVFKVID